MLTPPISDFPSDVLKLIKQNASPQQSFKLMRTNKYFQHQSFPFTVVSSFVSTDPIEVQDHGMIFHLFFPSKPSINIEYSEELPNNLWLNNDFMLQKSTKIISEIFPKIVYCGLRSLRLMNQELSWEDYERLTAARTLNFVLLNNTSVKAKEGEQASLEDLLVKIPLVKHLE